MTIEADKLIHNTEKNSTILIGNVKLYKQGQSIEADRIESYENGDFLAKGNVRLIDTFGNVTTTNYLKSDKDLKNALVGQFHRETVERTFMAAESGKRISGKEVIYENFVYTACDDCKEKPNKMPSWQIKSSKVRHDEEKKRIYFSHARLEAWGLPVLYIPYLFVPDGTEKRQSGILAPHMISNNKLGTGLELSYYHILSPNNDITYTPVYYAVQGFMPKIEWNYGTDSFKNTFRGAVINQKNTEVFNVNTGLYPYHEAPGAKSTRYYVNNIGSLLLSPKWTLSWDLHLFSDRLFMRDYSISAVTTSEMNTTVALTAQGDRSYFDLRMVRYQGITIGDRQTEIPNAIPQFDYYKSFGSKILGGEMTLRANAIMLQRDQADFDLKNNVTGCDAETNINNSRFDCLLRGLPGHYMRSSVEMHWRKRIYDKLGQVFEPFAAIRGDIAAYALRPNNDVMSYLGSEWGQSNTLARFMPMVGMTYRFPFVNLNRSGSLLIEPVAQFVARPNENNIGRMPNEDAQSLVFDDSTLFATNKFSGWDRVEGGGRLNFGVNVTARLNNGVYFNALFGQSRHLFGVNSYNYGVPINATNTFDMAGTGANSGLDKPRSDYVSRFQLRPYENIMLSARFRFDEDTYRLMRTEVDATLLYKRLSFVGTYADYAERPLLGFLSARRGVGGAVSYRVTNNVTGYTSLRYDLDENRLDSIALGLNYLDDSVNYGFYYTRVFYYPALAGLAKPPDDNRFFFRLALRTLGEQRFSRSTLN